MRILVYGTDKFEDYNTFMRGLVVAIETCIGTDNKIEVLTAGPRIINSYTAQFINVTESFMRQKKIKMKFRRVKFNDVLEKFAEHEIDYVISYNAKNDRDKFLDPMIGKAEQHGVDAAFYRL